MTKSELEARVRSLEGQVAAFAPESQPLAHLDRLTALALPLEQRNVRQAEIDAAVERFRVYAERDPTYTEAYKGVLAEQAGNRLSGQEVTRLSAPIADADTIEKLADIAHLEFQKYYNGHYPMKEDFRRVVTAILRAAHGNTVALHQASMEFREVPDPSEELVSAYCNDEVDTFTDKFLGDLYLGIKRTAMPTDETRIEWLAEIRCAQKIFDDFARGMRGQSAPIADAHILSTTPPSPVSTWRYPTQAELDSPLFNAIWNCIKTWDVNIPDQYNGYMGAIGNHVTLILDAIRPHIDQSPVISDADTIKRLAGIGRQARQDQRIADNGKGYDISEEIERQDLAQVTAILRAATPHIDLDDDEADNIAMNFGVSELMRICDSSIRYGVNVPADDHDGRKERLELTDAEIDALARCMHDATNNIYVGGWWCPFEQLETTGPHGKRGIDAMARAAIAHLKGGA